MSQTTTAAIRVNLTNPRHHLWNNNGTWFVHYTAYPTPLTKQRFRVSLGTKRIDEAQRKRDRLLRQLIRCRRAAFVRHVVSGLDMSQDGI